MSNTIQCSPTYLVHSSDVLNIHRDGQMIYVSPEVEILPKSLYCNNMTIIIYSFQVFCLGWKLQRALSTPPQNILSLYGRLFFLSLFLGESNDQIKPQVLYIYYSFLRPTTHPAAVYLSSIYYITYYYRCFFFFFLVNI